MIVVRLSQQSSCEIRIFLFFVWWAVFLRYKSFFISCLISSHPKVQDTFLFNGLIIPKYKKKFFWINIRNFFQGVFFSVSGLGIDKCTSYLVNLLLTFSYNELKFLRFLNLFSKAIQDERLRSVSNKYANVINESNRC